MILQVSPPPPPPPPNGWMGGSPFAPCEGTACVPIDTYVVLLIFVALLFGFLKLIHYDDNNN